MKALSYRFLKIHRLYLVLVGGALIIAYSGCGFSPERYHPQFAMYRPHMTRVLILPPDVALFEELSDGTLMWQKQGSLDAQNHIQQAVIALLQLKGYDIRAADPYVSHQPELQGAQALFRSVNRSIQLHTYGPQLFPAKQKYFDYGIGSVRQVLEAADADGLVLVVGHQVASLQHPKAWVSIAVVEPGGAIVWYCMQGAKEVLGLQTPNGAMRLVNRTLQSLEGFDS